MVKTLDDLYVKITAIEKTGATPIFLNNSKGRVEIGKDIYKAYKNLIKQTNVNDGSFFIYGIPKEARYFCMPFEIVKGGIKNEKESI